MELVFPCTQPNATGTKKATTAAPMTKSDVYEERRRFIALIIFNMPKI
jgi:hypothetical protein